MQLKWQLDPKMKLHMKMMLISMGILFGSIFAYKMVMGMIIRHAMAEHQSPIIEVSTTKVGYDWWQPHIKATASLRAIRGVNVTTELAGMVQKIYFTPGDQVKEGDVLVQLKADADNALLHSLEANAELAQITYNRDKDQYNVHAISKQILDSDAANLKSLQAQVAQQAAIVAKKTIKAPFDGRLGISAVNPGQFVNPGDKIVTLQTLDPIYADFFVPQQSLAQLKMDQSVVITADTFPDKIFIGKITTINPAIDVNTRNVEVEATIANPLLELAPGMFTNIEVNTGTPVQYLTLPQMAISFNPYGEVAYLVNQTGVDKKGKPILVVKQSFVVTGEARGDQVTILKGLKEGDTVVTSGQLKLKNGSRVAVNNTVVPSISTESDVPDEY